MCSIEFNVTNYLLMAKLADKFDSVGWHEYTSLDELKLFNRYDVEYLKQLGLVEEKPNHEPTDLFRLTWAGYMIYWTLFPVD